ncbi:acyl carrier protein [Amycolatopsis anabasis]|uniref:acyl carrier protein n=1 Tax=Amycolatopsis anabasis TaxID=1840409 RepID=UPI00131CF7D4|nr:hypothetical protein [Amycolatopsis anabasis]
MAENMEGTSGAPLFFPSPDTAQPVPDVADLQPSAINLDPVALQAMNREELGKEILEMLACLRRRPLQEVTEGAPYTDGTLALDSMTAVWVISTVGKAFKRRLVRLSEVDNESLRSVGGVAQLIQQAIVPIDVAGAA